MNSPLQTIVVKMTLHTTITFCNTYIPPSTALHLCDLAHKETQLPKPFVIVGDFNSHNYLWGGNINGKGKVMERLKQDRSFVPTKRIVGGNMCPN